MKTKFLINLLKMAISAYDPKDSPNMLYKYGYESDSVCCKLFKLDNTLVLAIKGSTPRIFGLNLGKSSKNDKKLINLMFNKCENVECKYKTKVEFDKLNYLINLKNIVNAIIMIYPNTRIIFTGHSLGGALASLLSSVYKMEAVAFGSPGERYISNILHLDTNNTKIKHFGMCNDTIYTGQCKHLCNILGYEVNTIRHNGIAYCINTNNTLKSILYHSSTILLLYLQRLVN